MLAIYRKLDDSGTHEFVRKADGLGGGDGPIARVIHQQTPTPPLADLTFIGWHLNEAQIVHDFLTDSEKAEISTYRLIIDLKPTSKDELLYFQICDIWGCSDPGWTPLMLRLCFMFEASEAQQIQEVRRKRQFRAEHECQQAREFVYEFLYLTHGWKEGKWGWGTVGAVNGALLFPPHLDFFLNKMGITREEP